MDTFIHAANNVPAWQRRWLTKFSYGMCGVGKWLYRWKDQPHTKCPRCLTDNETVEHVVRCPHADASLIWTTGVEELREWMHSNDAALGLTEIVTQRLMEWRNGLDYTGVPDIDECLIPVVVEQDSIGWDNFCFGLVGKSMVQTQQAYLESCGKRSSGSAWVSKLIRKVWELRKKMWDHRNGCVHKDSPSLHQHEVNAMDQAIRREFAVGRDGLPFSFSGFFSGTVERVLQLDDISKSQWLNSIWLARDHIRKDLGLDKWPRELVAATFIQRAAQRRKVRKKRRRPEV